VRISDIGDIVLAAGTGIKGAKPLPFRSPVVDKESDEARPVAEPVLCVSFIVQTLGDVTLD